MFLEYGVMPGDSTCDKSLRSGIFSVLGKGFVPDIQFKASVYIGLGKEMWEIGAVLSQI